MEKDSTIASHSGPWGNGWAPTGNPEDMKHAGHHKVHDERRQNHPCQPKQRTSVDAQTHTDMPASVKRAAQDIAQGKSEHRRRPIDQQHTRPHRE